MTPASLIEQYGPRESMEYDVVIVGGGPAGLSAAIRLKQQAAEKGAEIGVCVLEKGSEIGAHILSGAVMDPRALNELIPDWKEQGAPLNVPVTEDKFLFLSETGAKAVPNWALPDNFKNHGNYVISLANVTRWLGTMAEALGVEIFPGFPAAEVLYNDDGSVKGVATGNMGVGKDGEPTGNFQLGMELHAKYTLFCEGCRGHLGRQLNEKFKLGKDSDPQVYGIGIKELWEIDPAKHQPGLVIHTAGWPLESDTYGGSFLYHIDNNQVMVGFVVGLAYQNPYLSPFEEFQRYKTHPAIRAILEGGKRVSYGARAITAGGLMSLPKLVFPGGALVGCDAGTLNASRIKGSHAAIKTGMLAAEAAFAALQAGRQGDELSAYPQAFEQSWLHTELQRTKNFKLWFKKGKLVGNLMTGIEQWLLPKLGMPIPPWTLHNTKKDNESLLPADQAPKIVYPKPDNKLTFDRLTDVYHSGTKHDDDQPIHLVIHDTDICNTRCVVEYGNPCQHFCPASVYEMVPDEAKPGALKLHINASNCVHCKTCDIADPYQIITWVTPEGGGGPNYKSL